MIGTAPYTVEKKPNRLRSELAAQISVIAVDKTSHRPPNILDPYLASTTPLPIQIIGGSIRQTTRLRTVAGACIVWCSA